MKLDRLASSRPLAEIPGEVAGAVTQQLDGWFVSETAHDPLLACAVAAAHAGQLQVGTAIAVAFPRSPMHLAYAAHDLQALTGGRFVLGLGSQVKPHIEKRFSATWSAPADRMEEYIRALRAIWSAWRTGATLDFRGAFYRHTLMTPYFTPPPHGHPDPAVWLAAVGPRMARVAGRVADGLLAHLFTTPRYLREVTVPELEQGVRDAGRDRQALEVVLPVLTVTGRDEASRRAAAEQVRGQIAFYGSTPAYRPVLERHGWGSLHEELHARSRAGDWDRMPALIDDEVLATFAVVAEPDQLASAIVARYGGLVDRVSIAGATLDDTTVVELGRALRAAS